MIKELRTTQCSQFPKQRCWSTGSKPRQKSRCDSHHSWGMCLAPLQRRYCLCHLHHHHCQCSWPGSNGRNTRTDTGFSSSNFQERRSEQNRGSEYHMSHSLQAAGKLSRDRNDWTILTEFNARTLTRLTRYALTRAPPLVLGHRPELGWVRRQQSWPPLQSWLWTLW